MRLRIALHGPSLVRARPRLAVQPLWRSLAPLGLGLLLGTSAAWSRPAPRQPAPRQPLLLPAVRPGRLPLRGRVGPRRHPPENWPKPLRVRRWLRVRLEYHNGVLRQHRPEAVTYGKARSHRRLATRFLARVYRGPRLLDVVCFNFPLLAPVESFTATGRRIMRQMTTHLRTAAQVRIPYPAGADRVLIEDVGTGRRWRLVLPIAKASQRPRRVPRPPHPRAAARAGASTHRRRPTARSRPRPRGGPAPARPPVRRSGP